MTSRISSALRRLLDKHRIVFWYDDKQELKQEFDALELPKVEKIEINNNEFSIKHKVLREQPKQQFVIYKQGQQPEPVKNWLLDIELAYAVFRTDQVAIWLSELELPNEFTELIAAHSAFFEVNGSSDKAKSKAEERKVALKQFILPEDTHNQIRLRMLAVAAGASHKGDARLDVVLELLLDELSNNKSSTYEFLKQCKLDIYMWTQIENHYGYVSVNPSVKDFVIELFKSCYTLDFSTGLLGSDFDDKELNSQKLTGSALVFFKRWKDNRKNEKAFEALSLECVDILNIESDLALRTLPELIELDYFEILDKKIIHELVNDVDNRTVSHGEVTLWCRQRRQGYWFAQYEHLYEAIDVASQFLALLDTVQFNMATATEAIKNYTNQWYRLDQLYRQYVHALKASSQITLLGDLSEKIEKLYLNKYLQPLTNGWQDHVDNMDAWHVADVKSQNQFFGHWVEHYLKKNKKICVIISDALRFEAGEEMLSRIRQEDRYQAKIEHALSSLPSYTQLGMAALLPQALDMPLKFAENKTGTVFIGDMSTQGTEARNKILKELKGERASAIQYKDLMELKLSESRELIKANDVLFIYHNRIDHTGDKMQSEGEAFEATNKTFDDLLKAVKKLTSGNASNILITADHGFIYQNSKLVESDFLETEINGDTSYKDRRFVLGKNLTCNNNFKSFSSRQLGLDGDVHAVIPKGIQRLRLSGSGSRFVHGGASLQEVVIPIISINKKRQSDTSLVDIDIIRGGSSIITSGQLAVTLYQKEAVSDKVQPRKVRVGIYTETGKLISDSHEILFDLIADNPREREMKLRFVLNQEADSANNQEVLLKLEEAVTGTNENQYQEYDKLRYTIRRSFTSDFDF